MTWSHDYKGYKSIVVLNYLNSFNPELQLKDTESTIKNKLKKKLTELRGSKLMATLVLVFKKIEVDDKTKYSTSYSH